MDFEIRRIFEERDHEHGPDFGLTDPQRETLKAALDVGYLDVPRDGNLTDLGDRLGISDTAASQRFRRGVKTLVERIVRPDSDDGPETVPHAPR